MAVYGYVRVSTRNQAEEGLSLDAQERQIRGYAMMHGMEIEEIISEKAVSGWKPISKRPEGGRLVASIRSGDVIICAKLDRMFRSARDALVVADELRKSGVSLHLLDLGGDVTGNGVSKVFFTIVAAFAEFERDRIAERITDVKANERTKSRFLGGSKPFGFRIEGDGQLTRDSKEQSVIKRVRHLRGEGKSLRSIANSVKTDGIEISHVTVKRILRDHEKFVVS